MHTSRTMTTSSHDSHEKQHELEDKNEDDRQLQEVTARNPYLFDGKAVDVV